ncbi:DeoR family transcriptional regulator [Mucilaginibacter sp. OK268]|uniref:DeoR family transcriptional regulator n=1 Tax=Mucilaginibacter sp. OK268 TaxID=1881048 RepID=UPI0011600606|nr:DeoR family transcriptional regulator [Mucilaginibacter sp. OK268]
MDYRSYEKRLDYILELIGKNRFRTIDDAATRFSCSTRTVKRMLNHLRDRGHDIQYDRLQKKYFIKKKE